MFSSDVSIREAEAGDMPALMQLAELDSRPLPSGRLVVAEVNGAILAALSEADGAVIADPFVYTAELQQLLKLRADQLTAQQRGRTPFLHSRDRAVSPI